MSTVFSVGIGHKQSCLLLKWALEIAMRHASISTDRPLAKGIFQVLGLTDDLDLSSPRHAGVVETFQDLKAQA